MSDQEKQGSNKSRSGSRIALLLQALDGYSNAAAFLGDDSALLSSGTFVQNYLTRDLQKLTAMYRSNWICKRIIDMPVEDATRAWYTLDSSLTQEELDEIKKLEAKHSVKQELANAMRWARLYGGSIALIALRGEEDNLDKPLDMDMLLPGCFQGLLVLDRVQGIAPSLELVKDLDDPDFGLPEFYDVNVNLGSKSGTLRLHHSRVLRFIGRELPNTEMEAESYWGASEMEHIYDELQKRCATSANIAQLVFQANVSTLKMGDFGDMLALGTDQQRKNIISAMEIENRFRTSYGLQVLSAEDSYENHPYTFSGLSDIYEQFMMDMAGAAEIPATKLFGRSPQGLNSTGESDLRNYYESIAQLQERMLRPALEKLLPILEISALGYAPEDTQIIFEPVATLSLEARAEVISKLSAQVIEAFKAGLISKEQAQAELKARGDSLGYWTSLAPDDKPKSTREISVPELSEHQQEILYPDSHHSGEEPDPLSEPESPDLE